MFSQINSILNILKENDKSYRIVFFSESSSNFLHYIKIMEYLLSKNINILYIYKDNNDPIININNKFLKAINIKYDFLLMNFFKRIEKKIIILTTPELGKSYLVKNIKNQYIYLNHSLISMHSGYVENAFNNFDYIICASKYQYNEMQNIKKINKLDIQNIKGGYPKLDLLNENRNKIKDSKRILIAPSWHNQEYIYQNLENLIKKLLINYKVVLRPHYETLKNNKIFSKIKNSNYNNNNLIIKTSNDSIDDLYECNYLITDWSGIAYEFLLFREKSIFFINSKNKIRNSNYQLINKLIFEENYRDNIGMEFDLNNISNIFDNNNNLVEFDIKIQENINELKNNIIFNFGNSYKIISEFLMNL